MYILCSFVFPVALAASTSQAHALIYFLVLLFTLMLIVWLIQVLEKCWKHEELFHLAGQLLEQLASLGGPVLSSAVEEKGYLTNFLQQLLCFISLWWADKISCSKSVHVGMIGFHSNSCYIYVANVVVCIVLLTPMGKCDATYSLP